MFTIHLPAYQLWNNCIQNFHLGRYIVGYTVGNLVFRRRTSGAVKRDFRTYIRHYTSPTDNFEYSYSHSNALLQLRFKSERCKSRIAARHPSKRDVIYDVKLFPTVYRKCDENAGKQYPQRSRTVINPLPDVTDYVRSPPFI